MDVYEGLTVSVFDEVRNDYIQGGYKYLIKGWALGGFEAYRTDKGFQFFLKSRNLKMKLKHTNEKVEVFDLIGKIREISFWDKKEIPEGARRFTGLSNGSYVDCYYLHVDDGSVIYKPNPNAKEVYKPLSLDEHLKFQKAYG